MASSVPGGIPALKGKLDGSALSSTFSIASSTKTGLKGDLCLPSDAILSARIKLVNLALHAAL